MPSGLAAMTIGPRVAGLSSWHEHNFRSPAFIGFAGVLAVLVSAPFEATRPLVRLPGQSITSLETVLLAAFGAAGLGRCTRPLAASVADAVDGSGCDLCPSVLTLAALLAPSDRANALHMVGRLTLAAGLVLLTTMAVTTAARGWTVMLVACATGAVTAVLVALDFTRLPFGQQLLAPFRTQIATVGAQVRASGPFQYPTIASMFLEIAFAFAIGSAVAGHRRRPRRAAAISMAALRSVDCRGHHPHATRAPGSSRWPVHC